VKCLSCGGILRYIYYTHFLLSRTVKEFWSVVNIWLMKYEVFRLPRSFCICLTLRAFDWYRNQWPWMTLNGHFALCLKIHASSEPTTKMWLKIGPAMSSVMYFLYLSATRFWWITLCVCSSMTSLSQYKVYTDIRGGSLERGRQTTVG